MKPQLTIPKALAMVEDLIKLHGPIAGKLPTRYERSVTTSWNRAFGLGASLTVEFKRADINTDPIYEPGVSIGWGSMQRDIPLALASIALYQQVVNLAALIVAVLGDYTVVLKKVGE